LRSALRDLPDPIPFEFARDFQARTLLLWGDRDALFSRADQDHCIEALPDARLRIYEETGHCPNWEQPERVASDIASLVLRR
jgi:pimeloyl-ACP methyl ester carboxylesterase